MVNLAPPRTTHFPVPTVAFDFNETLQDWLDNFQEVLNPRQMDGKTFQRGHTHWQLQNLGFVNIIFNLKIKKNLAQFMHFQCILQSPPSHNFD